MRTSRVRWTTVNEILKLFLLILWEKQISSSYLDFRSRFLIAQPLLHAEGHGSPEKLPWSTMSLSNRADGIDRDPAYTNHEVMYLGMSYSEKNGLFAVSSSPVDIVDCVSQGWKPPRRAFCSYVHGWCVWSGRLCSVVWLLPGNAVARLFPRPVSRSSC